MKNKYKLISMFVFGIVSLFVMGFTDVHASTLVQEEIDGFYYTRRGGGKPYMSAQYNTYTMDGKVVYCIEPGVDITTHDYVGAVGMVNSPYSKEINQKIQLIGYYGYDYPSHKTLRYRMAAQSLIWETTGGQIIEFWTERYGNGDFINLNKERNDIMALVNAHYEKPSFNGEVKTGVIGQPITFSDSNSILSQYEIYKSDNATSVINGNTLTITPNVVGEINVSLKRKSYTNNPTTIFVGIDEVSQKMGYFGLYDPILSNIRLNVLGGKISLEKLDSSTLSFKPVGDATLKDATYGIYDEHDIRVGGLTTTGNSIVTSDYLTKLGTFYLKEEISSNGYKLDPTKYYFEITADNLNPKITVYEEVIEKDFELFKVKADGTTTILKAEPNVTFDFYLKSSMELYTSGTTNEKGRFVVTLPYGTFIARQRTTTPNFEKIQDFEIVIDENSEDTITKIISNAETSSKVKVVKVDSESKKILVKDGIKFRIRNLDTNELVCQNITYPTQSKVCVFETTGGMFVTPYVLSSGNYQIEELEDQKIDGYVWNKEPLKFSINDNSDFIYDEEFGVILEVRFENKEVKGEFDLTKIGEKLVIEDDSYKYEEITLDGVSYDLYADGDIYSGDGTLIYKDKELIKSFKTIDGKHKESNLYLGNYCLIETSSVLNNVVDSTPYCFSLKYKDQYTDVVSISFTLKNYLPKGTLVFTKTDLVTGEPIKDTLVEIYTENDEKIFSGMTNDKGEIILEKLFIGKGYILEKEPNSNYQITDEKVFFEIKEDGEIVKANMTNEKIIVEVPKTSVADSKVVTIVTIACIVAGLGFIIYDKKRKK